MPIDPWADELAQAIREHESGNLNEAEARYRGILTADPRHAGALHLLGVLVHQRGRHEEALATITTAIAIDPKRANFHNNRGVVLRALDRVDDAMAAYREAIRLRPNYADAHSNLATVLHEVQREAEALAEFTEALRLNPKHVDALYNFGNLRYDRGETDAAISLYERALKIAPNRADVWNNLGTAHGSQQRHEEAAEAFRRAVFLNPQSIGALANLASALARQDLIDEAIECLRAAGRLRPDDPRWTLSIASLCPVVFPDVPSIERYRADLESILDQHQGCGLPWDTADARHSECIPPFNLAHHGHDDRRIREKFAALYRASAPRPPARARPDTPRIGFVVTHPHEGVFLRCMGGLINNLTPGRFQPIVFGSPQGLPTLQRSIVNPGVQLVAIPDVFAGAAERIKAAECDLLYHWEVGTDRLNYVLPFARLAPVQCTSWGIQITSGVPAIDYYISSDLVEAPGAEAHYTETLVRLPTLLTYTERAPRSAEPADRAKFGLPTNAHLYVCLQRPQKLHPDFDELMAEILRRDAEGLIILLRGPGKQIAQRLTTRFLRTLPDVINRIALIPRMHPTEYHRLLSLADVVLDPLHYGAGSSAYDIFSYDLPLVTLPGPNNASRYVRACYHRMGLPDLPARSGQEYVDTAVRLGTNRTFRASWVARIAAATPLLFNDRGVVREYERFFGDAVNQARSRAT